MFLELKSMLLPRGPAKPGRAACFRYLFEPQMFVCLFVCLSVCLSVCFSAQMKNQNIPIFRTNWENVFPTFLYLHFFLLHFFLITLFFLPQLFFQLFWWIFLYPHFFFLPLLNSYSLFFLVLIFENLQEKVGGGGDRSAERHYFGD